MSHASIEMQITDEYVIITPAFEKDGKVVGTVRQVFDNEKERDDFWDEQGYKPEDHCKAHIINDLETMKSKIRAYPKSNKMSDLLEKNADKVMNCKNQFLMGKYAEKAGKQMNVNTTLKQDITLKFGLDEKGELKLDNLDELKNSTYSTEPNPEKREIMQAVWKLQKQLEVEIHHHSLSLVKEIIDPIFESGEKEKKNGVAIIRDVVVKLIELYDADLLEGKWTQDLPEPDDARKLRGQKVCVVKLIECMIKQTQIDFGNSGVQYIVNDLLDTIILTEDAEKIVNSAYGGKLHFNGSNI